MPEYQRPLIGIAGGIASGKSFITGQLQRKGAAVISADEAAHEALKLDDVKGQARARWGDGIFDSQGEIDRQALGKIVFAPPPDGVRELKHLEEITHPRIGEMLFKRMGELQLTPGIRAIVLDVPLLFEAGWNKFCDTVLFVDAPREVREARVQARGWTPAELARREAAQKPLDEKRAASDWVIDNSGAAAATERQIDDFWNRLLAGKSP